MGGSLGAEAKAFAVETLRDGKSWAEVNKASYGLPYGPVRR